MNEQGGLLLFREAARHNRIFNNLFYETRAALNYDCCGDRKVYPRGNVADYDAFFPTRKIAADVPPDDTYDGGHGVLADPKCADPARLDFRLLPGSPLIDKGKDVGLPFAGAAPDIGLFESPANR